VNDIDPEVQAAWDQALADGLRTESEGVVIWDRELDEAKSEPGRTIAPVVCAACVRRRNELGIVTASRHGALLVATRPEPDLVALMDDAKESSPGRKVPYPSSGIAILLDRATDGEAVVLRCRWHGPRTVAVSNIVERIAAYRKLGKVKPIPI